MHLQERFTAQGQSVINLRVKKCRQLLTKASSVFSSYVYYIQWHLCIPLLHWNLNRMASPAASSVLHLRMQCLQHMNAGMIISTTATLAVRSALLQPSFSFFVWYRITLVVHANSTIITIVTVLALKIANFLYMFMKLFSLMILCVVVRTALPRSHVRLSSWGAPQIFVEVLHSAAAATRHDLRIQPAALIIPAYANIDAAVVVKSVMQSIEVFYNLIQPGN